VRQRRISAVLGAALLAAITALVGLAIAEEGHGPRLRIVSPTAGQTIFGEVEVEVAVDPPGTPLSRVEIYVDGRRAGSATSPPWKIVIDAGQTNAAHHLEAVAYDARGARASASVRTAHIQTDEEIRVNLRQVYATVEHAGQAVLDLQRGDFEVYDRGAREPLVTFERGDVPFTAVLLLDSSTSMRGRQLETALDGARDFVSGMQRLDEGKLLLFSDRFLVETPFTGIPAVLTLSLSGVNAGGGTALNDALYLGLKRLGTRSGRRVAVVLSDGIDVESVLGMEQVRAIASRETTAVYWLRIGPTTVSPQVEGVSSAWRDTKGHRREQDLLAQTVEETGGRIESLESVDQVRGALARLIQELRGQYVLGYYPSQTKGSGTWHDIKVVARRADVKVRTYRGYREP
jgi:Ca-activated chloride channel family protein